MKNKQGLLDLVARAERGVLLPGEAQILRDAIELLDDVTAALNKIVDNAAEIRRLETLRDYHTTTTQEMRVVQPKVYRDPLASGVAASPRPPLGVTPEPTTCPYTHAHTRGWCGYPECRES